MNILDEIRDLFRKGNIMMRLIYINAAVFIVINLVFVLLFLFNTSGYSIGELHLYFSNKYLKYLMVPADIKQLIYKPWSLLTYMFLHFDIGHIFFNMLWFFIFGRIFIRYLSSNNMITAYLLGGLSGAFLYIISYNIFPGLSVQLDAAQLLGASAAVMAIAVAITAYIPNYMVNLIFIGPVRLKYITIVYIIFDIISIASSNSGGHISHIGGALFGLMYGMQLKEGKVPGKGFGSFFNDLFKIFKPKSKMRVSYKQAAKDMSDFDYNKQKVENQKEIDRILDKIAKAGYDSLSKKEKETLFKMSNKE